MKGYLLMIPFLLMAACSNQVESEINKQMLDDEVDFSYTIPELDGYLITKIDVSPRGGDVSRIDIYYTDVDNVDDDRQLMDAEEEYDEEFNIRTVYGPYEEWAEHGIVLIQSPKELGYSYNEVIEVEGQEVPFNHTKSGKESIIAFELTTEETYYYGTIFNVKDNPSDRQIRRSISPIYEQILEEYGEE
ncbi:hypothetical protein [Alteribacter keqinensis]|uniref:Uncharacterized protein n=1 Tax=Alteribacter keqinensis TaxID=2483800 RepID=A0A3M7TSW9_9BACI|nr:hypothetical protein [Alteribacter keqinensis]RNA68607.1 hypothetical protein EBO34_01150 [Alteribacter keqinensis]